jgi:hypothetical protein
MKNNKILVVLVIALILINCTLLAFWWFKAYPIRKHSEQGTAFEYLSNELKLTPAQKSQYEKMRNAHIYFADSVNAETRMKRDSFFDHIKDHSVKPEVINGLEKKISVNQEKMDTSTFYHFRRFRAILNADQQKKFDQVIRDVLHTMGGQPPQGRPGGRGMEEIQRQGPQLPYKHSEKDMLRQRPTNEGPPDGHYGNDMPPPGSPDGPPPRDGRFHNGPPPPRDGRPHDGPPPTDGPPEN